MSKGRDPVSSSSPSTVEPAHDQLPGWVDGRQRSPAAARELPDAGEQQRGADTDRQEAEQVYRVCETDMHASQPEEPQRHVAGEEAGKQQGPEDAAERERDHLDRLRSIRGSGTSQIKATVTYRAPAIHGRTNAEGIATA
jgi:hypothetical protein